MIVVVVSCELAYKLDALLLGGFLYFWDVIRIHRKCLIGLVVDEKVGVVVRTDGNWDDLHSCDRRERE